MPGVFYYDGSDWKNFNGNNKIFRYNGNSWVKGGGSGGLKIHRFGSNGSFAQMYPSTSVSASKTVKGGGYRNYKTSQSPTWQNEGDARQGFYYFRSGHSQYIGWLGLRRGSFSGAGKVTDVKDVNFTARRGSSGRYNNNQTITFRSVAMSKPTGNPFDAVKNGAFTCTTGAPGSGRMMSNRNVSGLGEVKNWLNGVGGADGLVLYNQEKSGSPYSSNYLDISDVKMEIDYLTSAYSIRYEQAPTTFSVERMPGAELMMVGGNPYIAYLVAEDEETLTYSQIMKKRALNLQSTPALGLSHTDGLEFEATVTAVKVVNKEDGPYLEVIGMNFAGKKVEVYSPRAGWVELDQRITEDGFPSQYVWEIKLSLDTDIFIDGGDPKIRIT